ncbi:MAG: penicillin-binding protein 2 [Campylobacteraceae bacterium]|nr:penicillin-binding protein 2 [Campylobacteraceae bacterium]
MTSNNNNNVNKTKKTFLLLAVILLAMIIFILVVFTTVAKKRKLPRINISKSELAIRGNILSYDNFKIASSKKIYKVAIDTRYLNKNKLDLFVKLLSIYSNIEEKILYNKINKSLKKRPGYIILSYNINSRTAKNLKELGFKLRRLGIFKSLYRNGTRLLVGLEVRESGEKRLYSYKDTLTPVVGYIRKFEASNGKTRVKGIKGIERSYNRLLNENKDGILSGQKDVLSYISFNKDSVIKNRIDGANLKLNIPLKLQKNIELILDKSKIKYGAKEIIVSIMESETGKIITLATSNRFNPGHIKQKDIPSLNVFAIEHQYEPGSVIKPISLSLAMEKNLIKKNELFSAYNKGKANAKGFYPKGRYPLGRFVIKDDHNFKKRYITLNDTVIFSSNIGTLQIAQRLKAEDFYEGFVRFGFTKKTGIDLPFEKSGYLPPKYRFKAGESKGRDNVFKATVSYGQGMTSTFMQVLKAYSVFNNNGYSVQPKIVNTYTINNKKISKSQITKEKVISKRTANRMKQMLINTVQKGTGRGTAIKGLEIGGKTGTAQLARRGKYLKRYISSFFGFANDSTMKYTIGVTVVEPISTGKYWYYHYASQSAVPLYKEVIQTLVKLNYLSPNK